MAAKKKPLVCPTCGERIECTLPIYAHIDAEDGDLVIDDVVLGEDAVLGDLDDGSPVHVLARWYCPNDHKMPARLIARINKHFASLDSFGRPPGSGSLGFIVRPPVVDPATV